MKALANHLIGRSLMRTPSRLASIILALFFCLSTARSQTLADLASYSGPDRTQRLIAGAKKEGALMIYSSMIVSDMGALISAFQAKYGIKAQQWRGSSEDVRNRAAQEYAAGRYEADVAETAGPDMEAMVRERLLQKVTTPAASELIPEAVMPHGQWIATRPSVFAGAHN